MSQVSSFKRQTVVGEQERIELFFLRLVESEPLEIYAKAQGRDHDCVIAEYNTQFLSWASGILPPPVNSGLLRTPVLRSQETIRRPSILAGTHKVSVSLVIVEA